MTKTVDMEQIFGSNESCRPFEPAQKLDIKLTSTLLGLPGIKEDIKALATRILVPGESFRLSSGGCAWAIGRPISEIDKVLARR